MSLVIECSLIVLVLFQQVFCQEEFQRLVIKRLEKVEKENVRLSNENRLFKTKLDVYENSMLVFLVFNRGDTVSRRSPIEGVRPSPYTTLCS